MNVNYTLDADVIIVGGGIVGSALATLLAGQGIRCLILDEKPSLPDPEKQDPRTLAITRASENILRVTGAWKHLPEDRIGYFRKMYVWDETGDGNIEFDSADLCEPTLGYIIEQSQLECALQQTNGEYKEITRYPSATIKSFQVFRDQVVVQLADDHELRAKLIVGADGARSVLRDQAGITYPVHAYQQQAVACIAETELPHEFVARQRFLTNGPLAFLPMADPHHCGIVWSTTPGHARELLGMGMDDFNTTLGEAFSMTLGQILSSRMHASFPLQHAQADRYCLPRLVLAGDAAHTIHPMAGQGANLGLLDVATLAEILLGATSMKKDIGEYKVLRKYERWRKGENFLMIEVVHGLKLLFGSKLSSARYMRNLGLDMMDMLFPVKHMIMRYAMGMSGDLPVIARHQ